MVTLRRGNRYLEGQHMRGHTVFMDSLVANGVTHLFGNPGTTENPILDSLIDYPQIEYIMHLHEGVAVGAAGYYAQASGRTGVVNLHVAPGLGNALGMMYGALRAGSPLLVTAGQQDTRMRLHEPVLQHDLIAMAAPVTKWSAQVERADEMAPMLRRAFRIAREAPAGPVFLALPIDVMEQETGISAEAPGVLFHQVRADQAGIDALAEALAAAANPVIVAGDEVGFARAHEELAALAQTCGAGVFQETLRTHVALPSTHAHNQGLVPVDRAGIRRALDGSDVVLLLGATLFEEVWYDPVQAIPESAKVLQITDYVGGLAKKLPVDLAVSGGFVDTLARLAEAVSARIDGSIVAGRSAELEAAHRLRTDAAENRLAGVAGQTPMSSATALHEIAKALPDDVVVVDETITAIGDVLAHISFQKPGDFFGARGGGIGQGIAGALGVKIANPDRPVVALSGDGSAMYSIQALWTAAHHELDMLFVILSNREYRVLKHNLDAYRQRFDISSNKPYPNMDLTHPTLGFAAMAEGMGVTARQITDPDELADAVRAALAAGGPQLLDVVISGLEGSS
jgi:benzoylformate decarboxylase